MAGPRRSRRLLPPRAPLRHGRPCLQPHLGARARRGRPLPDQRVRHDLRRDHRLEPGEDRLRRQGGAGFRNRLRHQPRRLRHPQRSAQGTPGRGLRDPHPFDRRHGGLGARLRPAADHADRDVLRRRRHARVRERGDRPGRAGAAGPRSRQVQGDDPAQPRPARRGADGFGGLHQPLLARARLQGASGGDGVQHQAASSGAGRDREDQPPLPARDAPALGPARMAGAAAPRRQEVPRLPRLKQLEGKSIVVTGAGGGIGRDFALAMAAAGAKVLVNDIGTSVKGEGRDAGPAQKVVDEIRAAGGTAAANTDSVADWESANKIINGALEAFGRIDVVVNNAGILRDRFFFNMSPEEWRAVIDVHLNGSFYVARAAAPHFKSQESGSYIHMTSTSGLVGNLGQANYSAAKLGIAALSKSIALDMAKYHVRSNCISPFAWSRMIGSIPTETPEEQARVDRLKQMTPAKIAPLAVYLASDAAKDISGQIFAVRANEIFLMSQSRPLRSVHRADGWTPETIASQAIPALRPHFYPLERSQDVFSWDPL